VSRVGLHRICTRALLCALGVIRDARFQPIYRSKAGSGPLFRHANDPPAQNRFLVQVCTSRR